MSDNQIHHPTLRVNKLPSNSERLEHYHKIQEFNPDLHKDCIIQNSLLAFLPDLSHKYAKNDITCDQDNDYLEEWIQLARKYSEALVQDFNLICDKQMRLLKIVKSTVYFNQQFCMEKVCDLPEDCILHIYSYFGASARLDIKSKYIADLETMLMSLSMRWLCEIKKGICMKYEWLYARVHLLNRHNYTRIERNNAVNYMSLVKRYAYANGNVSKRIKISQIITIFRIYQNAIECPNHYLLYEYQQNAIELLNTIIYVSKKYYEKKQEAIVRKQLLRNPV